MGLADELRNEFAHLAEGTDEVQAQVDQVAAALETADPAQVEAFCQAVGVETRDKRSAARAIAIAQQIWTAAKTAFPLLAGL
jgi:hypothetical protein